MFIENKSFEKENYTISPLDKGEYDQCVFTHCDFTNADLTQICFNDCSFISCNLSMARITGTSFRTVGFKDCKLLGLLFDSCNGIGISFHFENCQMDHVSFLGCK